MSGDPTLFATISKVDSEVTFNPNLRAVLANVDSEITFNPNLRAVIAKVDSEITFSPNVRSMLAVIDETIPPIVPPTDPAKAHYLHEGKDIDYWSLTGVSTGDVIVQKDLIGIVMHSIKANWLGCLRVTGTFKVPKKTGPGTSISIGKIVYWNEQSEHAVTVQLSNEKLLGKCVASASENDAEVKVRLSQ